MSEIPTLISLGVILATVVGGFVRMETRQSYLIKQVEKINGSLETVKREQIDHIKDYHSSKVGG